MKWELSWPWTRLSCRSPTSSGPHRCSSCRSRRDPPGRHSGHWQPRRSHSRRHVTGRVRILARAVRRREGWIENLSETCRDGTSGIRGRGGTEEGIRRGGRRGSRAARARARARRDDAAVGGRGGRRRSPPIEGHLLRFQAPLWPEHPSGSFAGWRRQESSDHAGGGGTFRRGFIDELACDVSGRQLASVGFEVGECGGMALVEPEPGTVVTY